MNKITLIGRLGKDAELKMTPAGKPVLEMSIAVADGWGETKSVIWIRASMFGDRAEKLAEYLLKGQQIYAEGRLRHKDGNPVAFMRKDGTPGAAFEIIVTEVELLGGKKQKQEPEEDAGGF